LVSYRPGGPVALPAAQGRRSREAIRADDLLKHYRRTTALAGVRAGCYAPLGRVELLIDRQRRVGDLGSCQNDRKGCTAIAREAERA
jgi:hypothetical protein